MGRGAQSDGLFMAADIASIAATATVVRVTDFTDIPRPVWDLDTLAIQCYVTGGNASATGNVVFKFQGSVNGVNFESGDIYFYSMTIAMSGTTAMEKIELVNVLGIHTMRLAAIENEDASYTATVVNARWGKSYGSDRW